MTKQYIDFVTNDYIIEIDGVIVFSISLKDQQNVEIRSAKDVYNGKITDIKFEK